MLEDRPESHRVLPGWRGVTRWPTEAAGWWWLASTSRNQRAMERSPNQRATWSELHLRKIAVEVGLPGDRQEGQMGQVPPRFEAISLKPKSREERRDVRLVRMHQFQEDVGMRGGWGNSHICGLL